ncbi:MAG: fumarylacetoacetate hydrolase family protein [Pseudomonadota bacterium]|nr:fumarylacetoacetate hydrolase family protein [Pseudomonadota bacterium]
MKFLSFIHEDKLQFGGVTGEGVVNLSHRFPKLPNLRQAIREQRLGELSDTVNSAIPDHTLDEIKFAPPIPNPEKIICIGVNYANRNAEYKDGSDLPKYPSVFMRSRESLIGHQQNIMNPPESDQLDYEGEIVLVIGKEGRRISEVKAHEYIAGITIMNEGSVRDYLRHAKFNVTQGKNFEASGSVGPWIVTSDELDPMSKLQVITRVNMAERQNDVTDNLMYPFRFLISYLSSFYRLKPGDLIATGTPNGAGARFDPPKYLRQGDVVEVEVSGVGVLSNSIVDEIE